MSGNQMQCDFTALCEKLREDFVAALIREREARGWHVDKTIVSSVIGGNVVTTNDEAILATYQLYWKAVYAMVLADIKKHCGSDTTKYVHLHNDWIRFIEATHIQFVEAETIVFVASEELFSILASTLKDGFIVIACNMYSDYEADDETAETSTTAATPATPTTPTTPATSTTPATPATSTTPTTPATLAETPATLVKTPATLVKTPTTSVDTPTTPAMLATPTTPATLAETTTTPATPATPATLAETTATPTTPAKPATPAETTAEREKMLAEREQMLAESRSNAWWNIFTTFVQCYFKIK